MSDISDRYRRNAAAFAASIGAVPDDRWGNPAPCEGWDAREVVRHVIDTHAMFEGFVKREPAAGPSVDDDPAGAFAAVTAKVQEELDDQTQADEEFEGLLGRSTFAQSIDRFISADLVVHRWDLARATGGDETMPADEVERLLAEFQAFPPDAMRSPQVFGPEIEAPEGADAQTRLLCFTGRRP